MARRSEDGKRETRLAGLRSGLRDLFGPPGAASGIRRSDGDPARRDGGEPVRWDGGEPARWDGATPDGTPPSVVVAPGPEELRKRRVSGRRRWYAGSLVGLSFLVVAMVQAGTSAGSVGSVVAFEVLAVIFGTCYVLLPVRVAGGLAQAPSGSVTRLAALALMVAITVPMIALGGTGVTALWIYIGVAAAIMFPLRAAMATGALLAAAMLLVAGLAGDPLPWELALTLLALTLWMVGFAGNIRLTIELRDTRDELARAAVAAERARIGRDLHDILGHSLTAIAVKAGLARRLVDRDAAAASTEISDVERLAREALADVRATAAGYRDVSLAGELAVARSVLTAAGIRADLPTAVDDVSPAGRQVFGYVVREAVTNVVRHSGAHRCTIELTRTSVRISDDGRGLRPPGRAAARPARGEGGGLRGLAERVAAAGGRLEAGPRPGGGFHVTATLGDTRSGEDHPGPAGRGDSVTALSGGTGDDARTAGATGTATPADRSSR